MFYVKMAISEEGGGGCISLVVKQLTFDPSEDWMEMTKEVFDQNQQVNYLVS